MHIHCKKSNTEFIKHNMKVPPFITFEESLNGEIPIMFHKLIEDLIALYTCSDIVYFIISIYH